MRIAILSDIHANLPALRAVIDDISEQGRADRVLCLGDIVGYNTEPAECIALVRQVKAVCVAGNHDRAVASVISTEGFSDTAKQAVDWMRERLDPGALTFLAGLPLQASYDHGLVAVHGTLTPTVRMRNDLSR